VKPRGMIPFLIALFSLGCLPWEMPQRTVDQYILAVQDRDLQATFRLTTVEFREMIAGTPDGDSVLDRYEKSMKDLHRKFEKDRGEGKLVTGTHFDTQTSDNVYETIEEESTGGARKNRVSSLEHKWTFTLTGGALITFQLEAFHTPNSEGDDILFAFSLDDVAYTDMFTLTKTVDDDGFDSFLLPSGLQGTLFIRALDTDRTPGNRSLDSLFVDRMFVDVQTPADCDDLDPNNFPGNIEICDNQDNNCDTVVDEGFDQDGDGFTTCDLPVPDCDDTDPAVNPAATEGPAGDPTCSDTLDNDCDGTTDQSDPGCQSNP